MECVVPRVLAPVAGRPLIWHPLSWLCAARIRKVSICANRDTLALCDNMGSGRAMNLDLDYYEDTMPRGPAGCTKDAVGYSGETTFVVVEGTIIPQIDLDGLLSVHRESGAALTLVAADSPLTPGHAEGMREPVGIYVFSRAALAHVPARGYQDIKEALVPRLRAHGEWVGTHVVPQDAAPRVRATASYLAVNKWAVEHLVRRGGCEIGYRWVDEAWVHESVRKAATSRLLGPVLVERDCVVEEDALVVGPTTIGAGCTIGRGAVVSRSVIWSDCRIGPGAHLDHCVVTDHSQVRGGEWASKRVWMAPHRRRGLSERLSPGLDPAPAGEKPLQAGAAIGRDPAGTGVGGVEPKGACYSP